MFLVYLRYLVVSYVHRNYFGSDTEDLINGFVTDLRSMIYQYFYINADLKADIAFSAAVFVSNFSLNDTNDYYLLKHTVSHQFLWKISSYCPRKQHFWSNHSYSLQITHHYSVDNRLDWFAGLMDSVNYLWLLSFLWCRHHESCWWFTRSCFRIIGCDVWIIRILW